MSRRNSMLLLILAAFCFSIFSLFARTFKGIDPPIILFWTYAVGFLVLLIFFRKSFFHKPSKSLMALGLCNALATLSYFWASLSLPLATVGLLINTAPIWVMVLTSSFGLEKLTKQNFFHMVLGVGAVILILDPSEIFSGELSAWTFLGLLSGFFYGLMFLFSRTVQKKGESTFFLLFWIYAVGVVFFSPWVLDAPLPFSSDQIFPLLFFIAVVIIGNMAFYHAFKKVPAQESSIITLMEIFFMAFWGFLFFSEVPSTLAFIGGTLLLGNSIVMTKASSGS